MIKQYVIIGAGNGGQSLAGDMVLRGAPVSAIYSRGKKAIDSIKIRGGIQMSGPIVKGFAPIKLATNDLKEAIDAGNVFLVCTTANAYNELAKQIAAYVKPEHTYLLIPGYIGSSVMFAKTLSENGVTEMPLIGETMSFPYATRLIKPAHAGIMLRKKVLPIAAFPATRGQDLLDTIKPAIFEAELEQDTLVTGFNNVQAVLHVAPYLLNMDKAEAPRKCDIDFHTWGKTTVLRLQNEMDKERCAVAAALGIKTLTNPETAELYYDGKQYKPLAQKTKKLSPNAIQVPDRYIDEDVPYALVPLSAFAKKLGIHTPVTDAMIQMSCVVRGRDFIKEGVTLETLGFCNMSPDEIKMYFKQGYNELNELQHDECSYTVCCPRYNVISKTS